MNRGYIFALALLFFTLDLAAQQEGYVQGNGVKIFYRSYGKGTPVLIINGGPGLNSDGFQELAEKLATRNRVIIYDQRGTGHSVLPTIDSSSITMALMLDDIESLRTQLGIQKWIVLGHSFGGMLASFYAGERPSEITRMILSSSGGIDLDLLNYVNANINARLTKEQADSFAYWTQKIAAGDSSLNARQRRAAALANAYVVDKSFAPKIAARLAQLNAQINGLIWQDLQKIHFDCSKQLAAFRQPVLIIQGRQDIIEAKTGERAHRILK
ncbi:MAG TPA: alpha/beta hydrolase, partial [Chitinophagaceae bacterium]